VAPLDDEDAVRKIFAEHGKDIAAVILEPLPANYGLLIQRREFIEETVKVARAHGALVIFDEVIPDFASRWAAWRKCSACVPIW